MFVSITVTEEEVLYWGLVHSSILDQLSTLGRIQKALKVYFPLANNCL